MRKFILILIILSIILYGLLFENKIIIWYYSYRLAQLVKDPTNKQKEVDNLRELIHKNSWHTLAGDNDPRAISDTAQLLRGIYESIKGNKRPIATCGPRAFAMRSVLNRLKYKTRVIFVFSDDYPIVQSHTFLEVFIEGNWQIQDPDLNIYYVDKENRRIETMAVLLRTGQPMNGWGENNNGPIPLQSFFDAMMIDYELMIIEDFDMNKVFPEDGLTFLEFSNKHYGNLKWENLN